MHLKSSRGLYSHHGIYIGNEEVIHYSGFSETFKSGKIEKISLTEFSGTKGYEIIEHTNIKYSCIEIVNRAKSRLGEDGYNLVVNNCEHFVNWCIENKHASKQAFISRAYDKNKNNQINFSLKEAERLETFRREKLKKFF